MAYHCVFGLPPQETFLGSTKGGTLNVYGTQVIFWMQTYKLPLF